MKSVHMVNVFYGAMFLRGEKQLEDPAFPHERLRRTSFLVSRYQSFPPESFTPLATLEISVEYYGVKTNFHFTNEKVLTESAF